MMINECKDYPLGCYKCPYWSKYFGYCTISKMFWVTGDIKDDYNNWFKK